VKVFQGEMDCAQVVGNSPIKLKQSYTVCTT